MVLGGLGVWFGGGLGLTWQVNVIKMLLNFFFNYWYYHKKKHILSVKKVVLDGLEVVWRWFGGGLGWFRCFHGA